MSGDAVTNFGPSPDTLQRLAFFRAPGVQRDYDLKTPVTDVIIHPNQGEIISSDQSGVVRIWDLGENACTHELVPEEDVPVKSVSMAGDGGILVAGNNKVSYSGFLRTS